MSNAAPPACTPCSSRRPPGFTLVELIVAGVLISMIAGAGVVVLSSAARARESGGARSEAASRASAAVDRIISDLNNLVRDSALVHTRLMVIDAGSGDASQDQILLAASLVRPVRGIADQPEGREAEVQYRLAATPSAGSPASIPLGLTLWRRADANPGPDDVPEGGGVATAMVDGLESLSFAASDGQSWFTTWDSDTEGLPHAVYVTVTAVDSLGRSRATRRGVVAFDRVPVPSELEEVVESEDATEASGSGTTTTPSTGSATTGGNTNTGGGGAGGGGGGGGVTGRGNTGAPR